VQSTKPHPFLRFAAALAAATCLTTSLPAPAKADSAIGSYLAARQADISRNFTEVVKYGTRALASNPDRVDVLESLVVAYIALGNIDEALPNANHLLSLSENNQIALLVQLSDALKTEDWDEALTLLDGQLSVSPLVDDMIRAWASLGQGQMSEATKIFDTLAENDGTQNFALFQKALAMAHVGDFEGAAEIFGGETPALQLNRRGVLSYAQVLSQLERNEDAIDLLRKSRSPLPDAEVDAVLVSLEAGEALPFKGIDSPRDGIAELLFALSEGLVGETDSTIALIYNRIAEHLNPAHEGAIILSAQLLEQMQHHDLAVEAYARVSKDSFAYPHAALGRTDVLRRWDKLEEATAELQELAETYPDTPRFRVALGDTLMEQDRFAEARKAYDKAIASFKDELPTQWVTYFQRAIALTKLDEWTSAETDFRKSLELSPDEPNVLNYLGYSYVERQENLDEALSMIERAVEARPDSGYIVDSLGWVLFRLGRYQEAVTNMERAVEIMPVDPILNDHLGDTYWAVGRKREAEFQWNRALSFITEDTDMEELNPDRIRRKLDVGLDVVLEEEGADPLHAIQ